MPSSPKESIRPLLMKSLFPSHTGLKMDEGGRLIE
jgi:hypothetical protein